MTIAVALYQPDIPGNTGTILRLGACLGITINIIEPAGFDLSDRNLKRAGMDYVEIAHLQRHLDWSEFKNSMAAMNKRLVLFTTKAHASYFDFAYQPNDILLFGRESAGVPEFIHEEVKARLTIPMRRGFRSLNLAMSVAMGVGEAHRQTRLTAL